MVDDPPPNYSKKPRSSEYVYLTSSDREAHMRKKDKQKERMRELRSKPEYKEKERKRREEAKNFHKVPLEEIDANWRKQASHLEALRDLRQSRLNDNEPRMMYRGRLVTEEEKSRIIKGPSNIRARSDEYKKRRASRAREKRLKERFDRCGGLPALSREQRTARHAYEHHDNEFTKDRVTEIDTRIRFIRGEVSKRVYREMAEHFERKHGPEFWVNSTRPRLP